MTEHKNQLITELIEAALNEVQLHAEEPDSERYKQARERYEKAVRACVGESIHPQP